MTKDEMRAVLAGHLAKFRRWGYAELKSHVNVQGHLETFEESAPDGTEYSVTFDILWDDKAKGNIRVMGDLSRNMPLLGFIPIYIPDVCDGFIMTPEGRFLGE
jgi:hypothetical protein